MADKSSEIESKRSRIVKLRDWLNINKVFFETIAATLLSLMAIVISIAQIMISIKQNELNAIQTEVAQKQLDMTSKQTDLNSIQTEIAQEQLKMVKQQARIEQSAAWGELRNAMWEIMDQYPPSGTNALNNLSQEQKIAWLEKIRSLLDSQIKNPVLIQNRSCLGYWRNAISTAITARNWLGGVDMSKRPDFFITKANSILTDVMYVWEKIILNSDEVSASGGRPKKIQKSTQQKNRGDRE